MENISSFPMTQRSIDFDGSAPEKDWEEVSDFIDEELADLNRQIAALECQQLQLEQKRDGFDKIDLANVRMRARVIEAGKRTWTAAQLFSEWMVASKPKRDRDASDAALLNAAYNKNNNLKYFVVLNSKHNPIHLLAPHREAAKYIAWLNGRLSDPANGRFVKLTNQSEQLVQAIEDAIKIGWPGELEIMGQNVVHKRINQVF